MPDIDLKQLAEWIAELLGWSTLDVQSHHNHALTHTENGGAMKLWVSIEGGRLRVSADSMGTYDVTWHNERFPVITRSLEKTPPQIARDIERRVFPEYRALVAKLLDRKRKQHQSRNGGRRMTARQILRDTLKRRPQLATSCWSNVLAAGVVMVADDKGNWEYLTSSRASSIEVRMNELIKVLTEIIGLSNDSATVMIDEFGELAAQRHAMHCLYAMDKRRVKNPPAWFTASLKNDWSAPYGMPSDWLPTVMHFRVDENTFAQIERVMRKEKQTASLGE